MPIEAGKNIINLKFIDMKKHFHFIIFCVLVILIGLMHSCRKDMADNYKREVVQYDFSKDKQFFRQVRKFLESMRIHDNYTKLLIEWDINKGKICLCGVD